MELYPLGVDDKLGLTALRNALAQLCLSPAATEQCAQWAPLPTAEAALAHQRRVLELLRGWVQREGVPLGSLPDARPLLSELAVGGSYLSLAELGQLLRWLEVIRRAQKALAAMAEGAPSLAAFAQEVAPLPQLEADIRRVVAPDGSLREDASPALAELLRKERETQASVRSALSKALRLAQREGWTEEPELTLRNGQLLVPVQAADKHRFPGVVHDLSASGQTVYMEPLEALPLSNQLRELRLQVQHETVRILTALADRLRAELPALHRSLGWVTALDVLQAQAQLAYRLDAGPVAIEPGFRGLELQAARHPVLALAKGAAVVPLTVTLAAPERVLVISGPNAGGKSVALQTVGLLQVWAQAGMLLPVAAKSRFGWVDKLFVEMGDDQSVQNDLSTYSSHLTHLRAFLEGLTQNSLFLIDEFGTGTDPQLGGPIAEVLLEAFAERGALGVVTTHYSNLKDLATRHPLLANAAMQFDRASLRPTYQLELGLPGSSYALEMAARVGIPEVLLAKARTRMGVTRADTEQLLVELREEQQQLRARSGRTKFREEELEGLLKRVEAEKAELERQKKTLLRQAQQEAKAIVRQAKADAKLLLRQAEAPAMTEKQLDVLAQALLAPITVNELPPEPPAPTPEPEPEAEAPDWVLAKGGELTPGATVRVRSSGVVATVLKLKPKTAEVAVGDFRTTVPRSELELVRVKPVVAPSRPAQRPKLHESEVTLALDIRGKRPEEALPEVQRVLDQAHLQGLPSVAIVHGVGTGALKKAVRAFIREQCPQVRAMADAVATDGGAGVTVCQLS